MNGSKTLLLPEPALEGRQEKCLVDRLEVAQRGHSVVEVARLNSQGASVLDPHDAGRAAAVDPQAAELAL